MNKISALEQRLEKKNQQIEQQLLTTNSQILTQYCENLNKLTENAVTTIEKDMESQVKQIMLPLNKTLHQWQNKQQQLIQTTSKAWIVILLSTLICLGIMLAGMGVTVNYLSKRILNDSNQLAQLEALIQKQSQQLSTMQQLEQSQLHIIQTKQGKMLKIPNNLNLQDVRTDQTGQRYLKLP